MLAQEKAKWVCKNPQCFTEISFGKYCAPCKTLCNKHLIPDFIWCQRCKIRVQIKRYNPNTLTTKKRYCEECKTIINHERSKNYNVENRELVNLKNTIYRYNKKLKESKLIDVQ